MAGLQMAIISSKIVISFIYHTTVDLAGRLQTEFYHAPDSKA